MTVSLLIDITEKATKQSLSTEVFMKLPVPRIFLSPLSFEATRVQCHEDMMKKKEQKFKLESYNNGEGDTEVV